MTEEQMRSFLLGNMSEAQRREVEEEFFEQDEAYDRLQDSLNDLLDEYARGELDGEEQRRVEERLLDSPRTRVKLRLARALAQRDTHVPAGAARERRFAYSRWLPALASAASIGAIAWLGFNDVQAHRELRARVPVETSLQTPGVATLLLHPQLVRGAETVPEVVLPAGRDLVQVQLLTDEVYASYAIEIEAQGRGRVWTQTGLARDTHGAVVLWLPANLITPGSYEFLLYGIGGGTGGGARELLGSYPCRVLADTKRGESPTSTKPAQ